MAENRKMVARIDFECLDSDCASPIAFNLMTLRENQGQVACSNCHRAYQFDQAFLKKLEKLRNLVLAVKEAEDILGNVNVAVTTPAGEVKIPYQLLLTRLNTLISLDVAGRTVDFHFRIEPLNDEAFK